MLRACLTAAAAALALAAGPASGAVIGRPAGPISSVAADDGEIAWLRCFPDGLEQIWARHGSARATKVIGLGAGANCLDSGLLGIAADRLVVDFTDWGFRDWLPHELIVLGLRDGSVRTLDIDRPGTLFTDGDLHYFSAPAIAGASVTWWQQRNDGPDRLMVASLRAPETPAPAGERSGHVAGTWYNRRGDALLLVRGTGPDDLSRLVLRAVDGQEREIATATGSAPIIGADLNDRWLTFTTKTYPGGAGPPVGRIHAWRLDPLEEVSSWPVAPDTPERPAARDSGVGRLSGDTLVWNTHVSRGAGVFDGIRAARLPGRAAPWIWSILTRADRGVWVTRPAITGRSAIVAVTRFPRGNAGQAEVGLRLRSRLLSIPLDPARS